MRACLAVLALIAAASAGCGGSHPSNISPEEALSDQCQVLQTTSVNGTPCPSTTAPPAGGPAATASPTTSTSAATDAATSTLSALVGSCTYPPASYADVLCLGSVGATYKTLSTENTGIVGCSGTRTLIQIPRSYTGPLVLEALARAYVDNGNGNGGQLVAAYHPGDDPNTADGYTAGRLILDTPCQGGPSDLTYDMGNVDSANDVEITSGLPQP